MVKREKEDRLIFVFPDHHGAKSDRAAVGACLSDHARLRPDITIGLGDGIDAGGFLAQHHVMGFVAETEYTYEEDCAVFSGDLDAFQKNTGEMHLIEGNHDQRIEKWAVTSALRNGVDAEGLRRRNAPEFVMQYKQRGIRYYRRAERYCGLPIQGAFKIGKAHFLHGKIRGNGSPASMLHTYGVNMFYGHTHAMASKITNTMGSGAIGAWNCGTLSEKQPLWMHGDPTGWTHGYCLIAMARSGAFQAVLVTIVNGVSLLRSLRF